MCIGNLKTKLTCMLPHYYNKHFTYIHMKLCTYFLKGAKVKFKTIQSKAIHGTA